jgi:hypothetical protein
MINNDLGPDVGYKIHLVFNALAAPTERNNATRSDNPEFSERSWYIQAKPPLSMGFGFKPSAHMVIDSRITPVEILAQLEDILYGSDSGEPRFPTQAEILALFEVYATLQVTDNGDGTATITGPDDVVTQDGVDPTRWTIDWASVVNTEPNTYSISSL